MGDGFEGMEKVNTYAFESLEWNYYLYHDNSIYVGG
jgi:hypothetical protein